jgi:hypothetical protein
MASLVVHSSFFSLSANTRPLKRQSFLKPRTQSLTQQKPHILSLRKRTSTTVLFCSLHDQQQEEKSASHHVSGSSDSVEVQKEQQQEVDWKEDEEFKKFMGNPSIEAALELEKKRVYRRLKEMERETDGGNPLTKLCNNLVRDGLEGEKERLEKANDTFKALDLNKVFFSSLVYFISLKEM